MYWSILVITQAYAVPTYHIQFWKKKKKKINQVRYDFFLLYSFVLTFFLFFLTVSVSVKNYNNLKLKSEATVQNVNQAVNV